MKEFMHASYTYSDTPMTKDYKISYAPGLELGVRMLNATFNNISIIWWRSVLLVEETGIPGENK
jgi:hypothetical protein